MNRLNIIGASGHGKVVADIAVLNGYDDIVFWDDNEAIKECAGKPVIGKSTEVLDGDVFIAVGNADARKRLMRLYEDRSQPILLHPTSVIASDVVLGKGTVVMAGVVINPGVKLGQGVIINTSSSIDHDCVVGDFSHISIGAHLAGTVLIGESTWLGAGSIISNNISICSNCMIGAGAVVIRDIDQAGTYVGVPAKLIRKDRDNQIKE